MTTVKLQADYETRTITVTFDDGRTEQFQTRAAAVAMYPQLGAPVKLDQQTKTARRNERQQAGMKV
jgi:hypothetical protein